MLARRIVGITGISLWALVIVIVVVIGLQTVSHSDLSGRRRLRDVDKMSSEAERSEDNVEEENQLEGMAKDFVDLLVEGEFEEAVANFDSTMRKALPTGKLQEVWNSLIAQAGPFVKQVGVRTEKILQYEAVFVTCKFERDVLDAKVVYDKEKRIAGLFFIPSQAATE